MTISDEEGPVRKGRKKQRRVVLSSDEDEAPLPDSRSKRRQPVSDDEDEDLQPPRRQKRAFKVFEDKETSGGSTGDIIDESYNPCTDDNAADEDEDTSGQYQVSVTGQRTDIPSKYLRHLDHRVGGFSNVHISAAEKNRRKALFAQRTRAIIHHLKLLVAESKLFTKGNGPEFELFVSSFRVLFRKASEDWLVKCFLEGVDESTMCILGKVGFSIFDLLQLPRLTNSVLSEKSVYLDCLENILDHDYNTYVGSGTGQFGSLQRWFDYLTGKDTRTRHGSISCLPERAVNLRGLAHYGFEPEPFLPILAEGVFMVYLGTVTDPKRGSQAPSMHRNPGLYKAINKLRADCGLEAPVAKGLNTTWTFTQGWRGPGLKAGSKCVNCSRVVLPLKDPKFSRNDWYYANPDEPTSSHVKCKNCVIYQRTHGVERSDILEKRRPGFKPKTTAVGDRPEFCQYGDCDVPVDSWNGVTKKYLCKNHCNRANTGADMDTPFATPAQRPAGELPKTCEWEGCTMPVFQFSGKTNPPKYLCSVHTGRAQQGLNMDAAFRPHVEKSKSMREQPDECEFMITPLQKCTVPVKQFIGKGKKWLGKGTRPVEHEWSMFLCPTHYSRAQAGTNMYASFRKFKGRKKNGADDLE
ncbi:hypothetical protein HBI81_246180 [Parastagonospora nodorum]|nr:hypothetical protein HBI81_246180 [Parastagonospora nodorum]